MIVGLPVIPFSGGDRHRSVGCSGDVLVKYLDEIILTTA